MNICRATKADLKHVSKLYKLWQKENCTYGLCSETEKQLAKRLCRFFIVAKDDVGIITGFAIAQVKKQAQCVFGKKAVFLEIQDLFITSQERSKGIGHKLMHTLIQLAREKGIDNITIYSCNKDADRIIKYYKKYGFKVFCSNMFLKLK
jgi:GNAT superfamily N-acetyltransferase